MIKDKAQKRLAAKFCAAQGVVPFLEVTVRSPTGLEDSSVDITDIDVIGLDLGRSGIVQRLIFDCKAGWSKLSPINRSLWAAGLTKLVNANRAYLIQTREAPYSHKLAANTLDVHIHSEQTFLKYAHSITPNFSKDITYLDNLETWDSYIALRQTQPRLSQLLSFVSTEAALEHSGPRGVRLGLSALVKTGSELDPTKPLHRFLFNNSVSSFLIFLSLSASAMKDLFQFSMEKQDFERTVRYFIWEGREQYQSRRSMKIAIDKAKGDSTSEDFDLPAWPTFVHIMRSVLDAPEAIAELPFLAKEIAFRAMTVPRNDPDEHIRGLFMLNNRSRQFMFGTAAYLVQAAKLPKEFADLLESDINGLVTPGSPQKELMLSS